MNNATVSQSELSAGIGAVARASSARATLPVLAHVLLEASGETLALKCSDLEVTIQAQIAAQVGGDAAFTVPVRLLNDLVGTLPQENVSLDFGDKLGIVCSSFKSTMSGTTAVEFPMLPVPGNEASEVDGEILKAAIDRVVIASAVEQSRPVLTGVLFQFGDDGLTLAAADGFRLAVCKAKITGTGSVVIPARALTELSRLLASPGQVFLTLDKSQAFFEIVYQDELIKSALVVTQLIEGNFPDYNQIIPKLDTTRVTVNKKDLLRALNQSHIMARIEAGLTTLDIADGKLTIRATSAEMGNVESDLDAKIEGDDLTLAVNTRFFIDGVTAIEGATVEMRFNGAANPILLIDGDYRHVIMPMHVRGK